MAKQKEAEHKAEKEQELTKQDVQMQDINKLLEKYGGAEGAGLSQAQEDNLVPLIYVLQPLSPQCRKGANYVEGAEPGKIWLRNSPEPFHDQIEFQHCYFTKDYVEWVPRDDGGGFIGRHKEIPEEAQKLVDPKNPQKVRYKLPNGNELIETRYHVGIAYTEHGSYPYVIPFTSTGHTVSKAWMFKMNSAQHQSKRLPGFFKKYTLTTRERSNNMGTWYQLEIGPSTWCDEEELEAGKRLYEAFNEQKMAVATDEQPAPSQTDEIPF